MKRRPIFFAIAPLLVVGAALWGVNYRLDHPPLTKADKEFRALVAGADSVRGSQPDCQHSACTSYKTLEYPPLNAQQTREIIQYIRMLDQPVDNTIFVKRTCVNLNFYRGDKQLYNVVLMQSKIGSRLLWSWGEQEQLFSNYQIHPRSAMRLNRALDAYLPQRIRP